MHEQTQRNLDYYSRLTPGRGDYWRYMPAPRLRAETIRRVLAAAHPQSVVDLGCGDGTLLVEIREALPGAALAGIDLSEPQIEDNRRNMPDIAWFAANLESGAVDVPRRFDALTSSEVIEHLDDPAKLLQVAGTIANPAALLVLTTQSGAMRETEKRVGHHRHFTAGEMRKLLAENGWRPERVWNAGFPFHDLSKWAANLSPDRVMDTFGVKPYGLFKRSMAALLRALFLLNSNSRGAQLFAVARRMA